MSPPSPRASRGVALFTGALLLSAVAHAILLGGMRIRGSAPKLTVEDFPQSIAVELVQSAPALTLGSSPVSAPESTPEPTPEAIPESTPLLTADESPHLEITEADPHPSPTPKSTPTPRPAPPSQPKTLAKSAARAAATRSSASQVVYARPDYRSNPPPPYPQVARRNGWQGRAIIRATITAAGRVSTASLHRSSGYAVLDNAALQAVRQWRFLPRTIGGRAVESTVEVPVNFSLRR